MVRVPSPSQSQFQAVVCVSTPRMYPRSGYFLVIDILCLYILGVLAHTTAFDQSWRGDKTLKWVLIYAAWLHLMDPWGLRVTETTYLSLLRHAKKLSSVTFCITTAGIGKKWKCDIWTYVWVYVQMKWQTHFKSKIDVNSIANSLST